MQSLVWIATGKLVRSPWYGLNELNKQAAPSTGCH